MIGDGVAPRTILYCRAGKSPITGKSIVVKLDGGLLSFDGDATGNPRDPRAVRPGVLYICAPLFPQPSLSRASFARAQSRVGELGANLETNSLLVVRSSRALAIAPPCRPPRVRAFLS